MTALRNIVVVADPQLRDTAAFARAASLAHLSGASLQLFLFAFDPLIGHAGDVHAHVLQLARKEFMDERRDWLDGQAAALRAQGLPVDAEALWTAAPHEALIAKVLETGADLVVKQAARDPDLPRWLHSPADRNAIRYCPVPLMLVAHDSPSRPLRIAAAVDAFQDLAQRSPLNEAIVAAAQDLGRLCAAAVSAVSTFPWVALPSLNARQLAAIRQQAAQEHAQAFAALCERAGLPPAARHHLSGPPLQALPAFVTEAGIDLLVIGSIYRRGLSRLLLGSTAEELLGRVPCDLLLIKPQGFLQDLERHVDLPALRLRYGAADAPRPGRPWRPDRLRRLA